MSLPDSSYCTSQNMGDAHFLYLSGLVCWENHTFLDHLDKTCGKTEGSELEKRFFFYPWVISLARQTKTCLWKRCRKLNCVLCCRWRRWGDTATVWLSAQPVPKVRPTTSATTPTQSICGGTGRPQRYIKIYAHQLMMVAEFYTSSTSCELCHIVTSRSSCRPVRPSMCQIASQRVNSVDLSCCSLEELPAQLFYSQDLTHLNLKNNFMSPHKGVPALTRWVSAISTHQSHSALPSCVF